MNNRAWHFLKCLPSLAHGNISSKIFDLANRMAMIFILEKKGKTILLNWHCAEAERKYFYDILMSHHDFHMR